MGCNSSGNNGQEHVDNSESCSCSGEDCKSDTAKVSETKVNVKGGIGAPVAKGRSLSSGGEAPENDRKRNGSYNSRRKRAAGRESLFISIAALVVAIFTGIIMPACTVRTSLAFGGPDSDVVELMNRNGMPMPLAAIKVWNSGNSPASEIQATDSNTNVYFLVEEDSGDVHPMVGDLHLDPGESATILFYAPNEYLSGIYPRSFEEKHAGTDSLSNADGLSDIVFTVEYRSGSPLDLCGSQKHKIEVRRGSDKEINDLRERQRTQTEERELLDPLTDIFVITPVGLTIDGETESFVRVDPGYAVDNMHLPQTGA